jgi:hypothetical protein
MLFALARRSLTAPRHLCRLRVVVPIAVCLICTAGATACGGTSTGSAQQCGSIVGSPAAGGDAHTRTAEYCLLNAATHCTAATLQYTEVYVDVGVIHTFTITAQLLGKCTITDTAQPYSARSTGASTTYTCAAVQSQGNRVVVRGCGAEGDVLLPTVPLAGA